MGDLLRSLDQVDPAAGDRPLTRVFATFHTDVAGPAHPARVRLRPTARLDPGPVTFVEKEDGSTLANLPDDALWPILAAIGTVMVLSLLRPRELLILPSWVVPAARWC